jgi:hypothetical protein
MMHQPPVIAKSQISSSSAYEDGVIEILGGVFETRADVFPLQIRIVSENLIFRRSCSEHFQNVFDSDSHMADTRPAAAFFGIDCDS